MSTARTLTLAYLDVLNTREAKAAGGGGGGGGGKGKGGKGGGGGGKGGGKADSPGGALQLAVEKLLAKDVDSPDVDAVLQDLEAQVKVRRRGRGGIWVGRRRPSGSGRGAGRSGHWLRRNTGTPKQGMAGHCGAGVLWLVVGWRCWLPAITSGHRKCVWGRTWGRLVRLRR